MSRFQMSSTTKSRTSRRVPSPRKAFRPSSLAAVFVMMSVLLAMLNYKKSIFDSAAVTAQDGDDNDDDSLHNNRIAYDQSFGFFTDISNENWKQMQRIHARVFPNYWDRMTVGSNGPNDKGNINKLRNSKDWNGENFQEEFHCPMAQRVPPTSQADGPKWVCDPHRLRDPPPQKKKDCLVYSVGSNGKAEFEQGLRDIVGDSCEIHTFDLIKHNKRNGDFAVALNGSSTFHHWGLGNVNEGLIKTLEQTMIDLGHQNRTIDIFKIDCEWCEWFTFRDWLKQDIRQILVETHNAPMPNAKEFFLELHDAGFVIFSKEANYVNGAGGVEFAFLKLSTDFFIDDTMYQKNNKKGNGPRQS